MCLVASLVRASALSASGLRKSDRGVRAKEFRLCTRRERSEGTMDAPKTRHQEQAGSDSTPRSDRDHLIVSDIVVSKIAGIGAQEVEGVQVSSARTLGGFLDNVSTDGHPRSVSAMGGEEGVTINLTIGVEYGRGISPITGAVRTYDIKR